MRVMVFTTDEPLYLPRYLDPILNAHAAHITDLVIAPPPRPVREQIRRQYRMFGPMAFSRMSGRVARGWLLDRLPDTLTGRHHSVRSVARAHGVPVRRVDDVDDAGFIDWVEAHEPDILLSVVCGQKLGPRLLEVPDHAINLHGSLLPRYRGRGVAFWPLFYGDAETGVTAHVMTEDWDAGPIVEQRSVPIDGSETVHSLSLKLADCGSDLAVDLLARVAAGADLSTRPNQTTPADYHTLPTPAERREFRRRGNAFL